MISHEKLKQIIEHGEVSCPNCGNKLKALSNGLIATFESCKKDCKLIYIIYNDYITFGYKSNTIKLDFLTMQTFNNKNIVISNDLIEVDLFDIKDINRVLNFISAFS